jgi:murein DD-endopeptidase MepM/ murein hydrolase activator NlpD
LLNASDGAQRVLERLRLGPSRRSNLARNVHRRSLDVARSLAACRSTDEESRGSGAGLDIPRVCRSLADRFGAERALPVAVAGIVLAASALSFLPDTVQGGGVGGPTGDGPAPRVVIGGGVPDAVGRFEETGSQAGFVRYAGLRLIDPGAFHLEEEPEEPEEPEEADPINGPFLDDGTLLKPLAVDTSIADGSGLLRQYRVRAGDTLTGVAREHGVSMMTVWWANSLTSKDLKVGQALVVPTVNGLIVTVEEGDTLETVAAEHRVDAGAIYAVNGLEDPVLVIGQTLVVPGAVGAAIPTPKPTPTRAPVRTSSGGTVTAPSTYSGGAFAWPVVGGNNYISQYFRYGHYAIDIAAQYGSTVRAAAAGRVVFAGWKSNGGGYQVWVSHGSGLHTTYNHMSAVTVGTGQQVGKGQAVGRIGQTGRATGPHLHFEVWRGPIWDGGKRVNPLLYY